MDFTKSLYLDGTSQLVYGHRTVVAQVKNVCTSSNFLSETIFTKVSLLLPTPFNWLLVNFGGKFRDNGTDRWRVVSCLLVTWHLSIYTASIFFFYTGQIRVQQ